MQKKLLTILTVAALAAALAACGGEQPMHSDVPATDLPTSLTTQTEPAAQTSETTETTEPTSGDAITSLADWDKLNADGAYSDDMRAFFGRFLGENTTGIAEFDTVQISDYRIARREPDDADSINRLLFTFTVDASGLDTLPPGRYETLVEDLRDPTLTFLGDDPRDAAYPAAEEGCDSCTETYHALLTSCYVWNYPAYGAWTAENCNWLPVNYIVDRYGNGDKMAEDTFADLAARLFGFPQSLVGKFSTAEADGSRWVHAGSLGGGFYAVRAAHRIETDGRHVLTVQYFADDNHFVPSVRVEYAFGTDGEVYGTTVVGDSPYAPCGLQTSLTTQTEPAAQTTETTEATESASVDAITSLADWDKLNADGTYSDRTRAFLGRFLGENTTEIAEFDTVQISDYRIARLEPEVGINRLLFTFTVDASGLDTLPPGRYETVVEELRELTMTFLGDDPRAAAYPAAEEGCDACAETYSELLASCYIWHYPAYGAWNAENCDVFPVNYIVDRYGNHDKMAEDTFADLAERLFGFPREFVGRFSTTDENGRRWVYSGGLGGGFYAVRAAHRIETDGRHVLTVQYFADDNHFVPSVRVEYAFGTDGAVYGTTVVGDSPYKPYGVS